MKHQNCPNVTMLNPGMRTSSGLPQPIPHAGLTGSTFCSQILYNELISEVKEPDVEPKFTWYDSILWSSDLGPHRLWRKTPQQRDGKELLQVHHLGSGQGTYFHKACVVSVCEENNGYFR